MTPPPSKFHRQTRLGSSKKTAATCQRTASRLTIDDLEEIIEEEQDSLRFYYLGSKWRHKVEHIGSKALVDLFKDTLIG